MSEREPGQHPYARAYEKAAGTRTERAFVPPFRAPADQQATDRPPADEVAPPEDPDTPRRPVGDERPRGYGISRAALVLVALALGLGLLIGRVSVNNDPATVAQPTPTATKPVTVPLGPTTLRETGALCSQQRGNDLVLGVEVHNISTSQVSLTQLTVNLPAKGLTLVSTGTGTCGEIDPPALKEFGLPTQGTVWLSTTLRVTAACPAALPVSMVIYAADTTGRVQAIKVSGFKNLDAVKWSGCTPKKSTSSTKSSSTKTGGATKSAKKKTRKTTG